MRLELQRSKWTWLSSGYARTVGTAAPALAWVQDKVICRWCL